MKLTISGSTPRRSPDLFTTANFPLSPNTPYKLSGSMKTSGLSSGLTLYLFEQDSSGAWTKTGVPSLTGTNGWKAYAMTITTGPNTVQGYLKAYVYSGYGTVWLDDVKLSDVFGGDQPVAFGGTVTSSGGVLTQTASTDGLNLSAKFTSVGSAIKVDATLTDTTGADRGVEVAFRLPLDIAGWTWDNDFITPMTIDSGTRYEKLDTSFAGQTRGHTHSIYPFATVHNSAAAFSLAVPMGPLMERFSYDDTQGFRVTYDVGLSPATTQSPSKAIFSFWIYTNTPKWGMRSAAEKYYALNPASFTTSATVLGAWALGNTKPLSSVPNSGDFGWGYEEGNSNLAFDNAHGIVGTHYISCPAWEINISGYSSQPPYDVLVDTLNAALDSTGTTVDGIPTADMAAAVIASSPYDQDGLYQLSYNSYFWYGNKLQQYPVAAYSTMTNGVYPPRLQYSVDNQIASAQSDGNTLGGIFLDNTTSDFGNVENYRKSLWAYNKGPLSFSYRTGETVQYLGDAMADYTGALRSYLNDQGMILMASSNPGSYVWFAPNIDVIGSEVAGADNFDRTYARRTMSYGKIWTPLYVPGSTTQTQAKVLAYLRQALLLGYLPGFNGVYWDNSSLYERDRSLFKLYMPLIKTLAQAGWKPVHYATSSDASTLLERFGDAAAGTFYVSAQNSGTSPTSVQLTLDGAGLGIPASTAVTVQELLSNTARSVTRNGSNITFSETLDPGETTVYAVLLGSIPTPTVSSLSPSSGPAAGGSLGTINGDSFLSGAAVNVGVKLATDVAVIDSGKITASTPPLSPGTLNDLKVTNPGNASGTLLKAWFADFVDVPQANGFHDDVEKIFRAGITAGCGGGNYCPGTAVSRAQMAVFLLKAEHGSSYVPPACSGVFDDVSCPSPYANWIERLAAEGITSGCGGGDYCPAASATRAQMAVFLLKTEHGASYVPPACSGIFGDVACPGPYTNWIEQLATEERDGRVRRWQLLPERPDGPRADGDLPGADLLPALRASLRIPCQRLERRPTVPWHSTGARGDLSHCW